MKVGFLVGSLRKDSWNKKIAKEVKQLFPKDIEVDFIEISDLPIYNEDLESNEPESYVRFRKEAKEHDAFVFFTPEYNRSYSAAIKNALDIGSKAHDGNVWGGKPAGVISSSTGGYGAMAANHALRQVFVFIDLIPLQQPEVYLSRVDQYFENDELKEDTKKFLQRFVDAFVAHAKKVLA